MRLGPKLLALALAGALLLGGCTSPTQEQSSAPPVSPTATAQPIQAGVFSLAWDPQQSFHPITGTSGVNLELTGLVFQGLYELDQSFHPQPVLAAGATASQDGRTWTVEVAQGVRFSDGTPLTAAQVVSSLETARTAPRYQSRLSAVTGVRQTGEYTVEVTLSAPNANFTALLDIPVVAEREGQNPLGTGPYRLGDGALEQNPNSSLAGSLPAENIPLVAVSTPDARMAAFDSGEVWMTNTEFFSPDALGYSGSCEVWDYPTTQLLYLGFHTQGGACGEETLRRAVSAALNRESLVQVQLSGHGDPTDLPISPVWGELPEVEVEAGAPTAATLRLVVNNDNTTRVQVARQIAVQLESMTSLSSLDAFAPTIVRKYCLLVKNYSRRGYSSLVQTCLDYIDFHYAENLSLDSMARLCSVTNSYLSSLFKKEVSMTLTDYINSTRIHQSLILLNTTSLSIQEIAVQCGFSDANYYARTFKKLQGQSPKGYRDSIRMNLKNNSETTP